ncbi:Gustatory receptor 20, partial [Hyalella azteca]
MLYKSKISRSFFWVLKIFGALPFKPKVQPDCKESSQDECEIKLQQSRGWQAWSAVWTLMMVTVMAVDAYYAATDPRGKLVGCMTMVIAHMNCDITTSVTVILLQTIFWRQSDQLAQIWNHVNLLGKRVAWNNGVTLVMVTIIICSSVANVIIYIICLKDYTPSLSLVAVCTKVMIIAFWFAILGIIHHHGMHITGSYLTNILQPITDTFNQEMENRKLKINGITSKDAEKNLCTVSSERSSDIPNMSSMASQNIPRKLPSLLPISPKDGWLAMDPEHLKDGVLDAYSLLDDIKTYCERPLAVAMYCLIIWLLTSAFYLTLWPVMGFQQRILGSCHMIIAVVSLLYLLNSTHGLRKQLTNMKWMFTYLANHNSQHYKKQQVRIFQ